MTEDHSPKGLENDFGECTICLEQVQQPRALPCRHFFCQECLSTYITSEVAASSFACPVCRRMTLPVDPTESKDKWAKQFPTDNGIKNRAQVIRQSPDPMRCIPCQTKDNKQTPAKYWCKMMQTPFCGTCKINYHDVIHQLCDIVDITGESLPLQQEKSRPRCTIHNKKITWYCRDHEILGCSKCMIHEHGSCGQVVMATEYFETLKTGFHLSNMKTKLKDETEAIECLMKSVTLHVQTMADNQKSALQAVEDHRKLIDKHLDKQQENVTEKIVNSFKNDKEASDNALERCKCVTSRMSSTVELITKAEEEDDAIGTISLYHRGKQHVKSGEATFSEISSSLEFANIIYKTIPSKQAFIDNAFGEVEVERIPYSRTMLGCRVKEVGNIYIKTSSDFVDCNAHGVLYIADDRIVISDSNNRKVKLFTAEGKCLDEMNIRGYPCDVCRVGKDVFAVATYNPGGVRVLKMVKSKLSISSDIGLSMDKNCYGITYMDGMFIVGTEGGEIYTLKLDGTSESLYKFNSTCYSLTHHLSSGDIVTSVSCHSEGDADVAVFRLSVPTKRTVAAPVLSASTKSSSVNVEPSLPDGAKGVEAEPGLSTGERGEDAKNCMPSRSEVSTASFNTTELKVDVVKYALGIDVDREGNIYVCGRDSNNVIQMSVDGKHVMELLTSSDGIKRPWAIYVSGRKLLITAVSCNYLRIFQCY